MDFQGFIKTSLIDYPDRVSSVAFISGCNFKCGFCHNGDLVKRKGLESISEDIVIDHLDKRKGIIDGLVISGGEPTIHPGLIQVLRKLKSYNIPVKLDTNGSKPEVLEKIIDEDLVAYIAMDVKADEVHYEEVAGVPVDIDAIKSSIELIMASDIEYEFRTTVLKSLHSKKIMRNVAEMIKGSKKFVMQQYIENESQLEHVDYGLVTLSELFELKDYIENLKLIDQVDIRGKY